jgi:hypothetical protein
LKQADRSVVRRVVLAGRLSTYHEIVAQVAILNRNPPTSWVQVGSFAALHRLDASNATQHLCPDAAGRSARLESAFHGGIFT